MELLSTLKVLVCWTHYWEAVQKYHRTVRVCGFADRRKQRLICSAEIIEFPLGFRWNFSRESHLRPSSHKKKEVRRSRARQWPREKIFPPRATSCHKTALVCWQRSHQSSCFDASKQYFILEHCRHELRGHSSHILCGFHRHISKSGWVKLFSFILLRSCYG